MSNLETTNKTSIVNSINELCIETGTENGWKWEKYSNGKAICYGTFTRNVTVTSQWGSLYTGVFGTIDFPTNLFINAPISSSKATQGFSCWLITSGSSITNASSENIACVRPTNLSSSSITIDYIAIGQWK